MQTAHFLITPMHMLDVLLACTTCLIVKGLFANALCLDPDEGLSPGQADEIDRVYAAYPHLNDDAVVRENIDRWLK